MIQVGNELRKEHSPQYIIEELYNISIKTNKDCVIESIRCPGEIEFLRQFSSVYIFGIDANIKNRYERVIRRNSSTDHVSFEKFEEQEAKELSCEDPFKQNLSKCIFMANYTFQNDGSIEDLYFRIDEVFRSIKS